MRFKIVEKDHGFEELFKTIEKLKAAEEIQVGFFTPKGATIAATQTFGDGKDLPARPFLEPSIQRNRDKYIGILKRGLTAILEGKKKVPWVFSSLARTARADIRRYVRQGIEPALDPDTETADRARRPLIGTKRLLKGLRWRLVNPRTPATGGEGSE